AAAPTSRPELATTAAIVATTGTAQRRQTTWPGVSSFRNTEAHAPTVATRQSAWVMRSWPSPRDAFDAWVWLPGRNFRTTGLATAILLVSPGMLHVEPTRLGRWLRASPELDYDWSPVVVERHRPVPDVGV